MKFSAAAKCLLLAALSTQLAAAPPASPDGNWKNPSGSVIVHAGGCGGKLCGVVVWANAQALADARDAGNSHLVGMQILRDYVPSGPGRWTGEVYVPDRGQAYYSRIEQLRSDQIKVSGCILHGLFCRSQVWTRV